MPGYPSEFSQIDSALGDISELNNLSLFVHRRCSISIFAARSRDDFPTRVDLYKYKFPPNAGDKINFFYGIP